MNTYEVNIDLKSTGKTLNILVAAVDEGWANHEAACTLDGIGIYAGEHYDLVDGFRLKRVSVQPEFNDFWQAA